jgi:S1-C subfamily serine protease
VSNPLGLQHSVSRGVVSGLQREISGLEIGARLIQFDASINEGQSGGPLVDSRGSVVGVTTFKILGAEAIGFAIPIDLVRQTISDLERMGHPFRPEIGFSGTGVDPSLASLFELPVVWGVLVEQVEDKDYVLGGDIIVAVDDAPIVGPTGLIDSFLNARPGQVLELEVVRGNKTVRIELTVPEMVH